MTTLTATYSKGYSGRLSGRYGPAWTVVSPCCTGLHGGTFMARFRISRTKGTYTCEACGTQYEWRAPKE